MMNNIKIFEDEVLEALNEPIPDPYIRQIESLPSVSDLSSGKCLVWRKNKESYEDEE